jgi:hypothetical protein
MVISQLLIEDAHLERLRNKIALGERALGVLTKGVEDEPVRHALLRELRRAREEFAAGGWLSRLGRGAS